MYSWIIFWVYANLNPSTTNKGDQGAQKGITINQIKTLYTIKINQSYYDKSLYTRIWASVQPIKATKRLRKGITIKINQNTPLCTKLWAPVQPVKATKRLRKGITIRINHYVQNSEPQYNQWRRPRGSRVKRTLVLPMKATKGFKITIIIKINQIIIYKLWASVQPMKATKRLKGKEKKYITKKKKSCHSHPCYKKYHQATKNT